MTQFPNKCEQCLWGQAGCVILYVACDISYSVVEKSLWHSLSDPFELLNKDIALFAHIFFVCLLLQSFLSFAHTTSF